MLLPCWTLVLLLQPHVVLNPHVLWPAVLLLLLLLLLLWLQLPQGTHARPLPCLSLLAMQKV